MLLKQVIDKHLEGKEWLAADQFTLAVRLTNNYSSCESWNAI